MNRIDNSIFNSEDHSHLRFNPLLDEYVLVSPYRLKRPWQGKIEDSSEDKDLENDPKNPLCPGATRSTGAVNPCYASTYIFDNDFPALLDTAPSDSIIDKGEDEFLKCHPATGTCKVMCFHPSTNVTLPEMPVENVIEVIDKWTEQVIELGPKYNWVQIFENKGDIMGCSNPHPHCQIWASSYLPNIPRIKDKNQKEYFKKYGRPMLLDYVNLEIKKKERIVVENDFWIVLVPFWAKWPYETILLPKKHIQRLSDLNENEKTGLADIIQKLLTKYDNLFDTIFPYSMGWHGAPTGKFLIENTEHWQLHAEYLPPLLRSRKIKKFMVGYEMLACPQRDLTAEKAAETLRNLPDIHYRLHKIKEVSKNLS